MIRKLNIDELDKVLPIAEQFYNSTEFLSNFNIEIFKKNWIQFIESGLGVIFVLEDENNIIGVLGGFKYPDVNSGELIATEFFWFVDADKRGNGIRLLKEFEKWAKEEDCKKIIMVYLCDLMPEKLDRVYKRLGYRRTEINYTKEVS